MRQESDEFRIYIYTNHALFHNLAKNRGSRKAHFQRL
jgi:hypothetical protein